MTIPEEILKKPYSRVIVPDESGLYSAELLEFPGCYADGETPEEAYKNLEDAAEAWLESAIAQGMSIPEPFASLEQSGTLSLRLPKSIHRRAVDFAHRDGVSLNTFLVAAVSSAVGAEQLATYASARVQSAIAQLENLQTARMIYSSVSIAPDVQSTSIDLFASGIPGGHYAANWGRARGMIPMATIAER